MLIQKRGELMQTRERKLKILKAIVEEYIRSGEPVGSKVLCSTLGFPISSATVRNEMAELSEMGLLTQPHTSAGRQPSEEGFRYYVNSLMEKKQLSGSVKSLISEELNLNSDDPEKLLHAVGQTVSELLNTTSIVTTPFSESARIRTLKFVQTGRQTCMAVLIASTGLIKTKLFKCDYVITPDIVNIYETIFNRDMEGLPVKSVTPAFIQTMAVGMGEIAFLVPSVLSAIMDICREVGGFSMTVTGREKLMLEQNSGISDIRGLTKLLHSDEELESLIMRLRGGKHFLIGSETGSPALGSFSFIASPYNIEPSSGGFISLILPMRCDYAYSAAVLEYTAEITGRLLREMLMIE